MILFYNIANDIKTQKFSNSYNAALIWGYNQRIEIFVQKELMSLILTVQIKFIWKIREKLIIKPVNQYLIGLIGMVNVGQVELS